MLLLTTQREKACLAWLAVVRKNSHIRLWFLPMVSGKNKVWTQSLEAEVGTWSLISGVSIATKQGEARFPPVGCSWDWPFCLSCLRNLLYNKFSELLACCELFLKQTHLFYRAQGKESLDKVQSYCMRSESKLVKLKMMPLAESHLRPVPLSQSHSSRRNVPP